MVCPDIDQLEDFMAERLDESAHTTLQRHIGECPACESRLADLTDNLQIVAPLRQAMARSSGGADPPGSIPGFRIQSELGRGGMGVIYLAEQDNPRRPVALKILRSDVLSDERRQRFLQEAHVLAHLRHPDIAQIHQVGVATCPDVDGRNVERPFIVMEYVQGPRLDDYARDRGLSLPQRLELLARICDAVHFAHLKGVIHRDLKPGNILISEPSHDRKGVPPEPQASACASPAAPCPHHQGVLPEPSHDRQGVLPEPGHDRQGVLPEPNQGTKGPRDQGIEGSANPQSAIRNPQFPADSAFPKILDFGVARVTDADLIRVNVETLHGQLVGTLPYMSPEQVAGDGDRIDARSDVYALGVVGYELLAGRLPFDCGGGSVSSAARVIQEETPPPLGALDRRLRGDVETIIGKALEKDPQRRYQSAAELAADLRRCLNHEPVLARPAGTAYVLRKFARRHRALVTTAAVAVAALIGVTGVAVGQARVAVRQRDAAERRLEYAQQAVRYLFSGVGAQLAHVLGTGDVQRHLAEEAYVFFKRLADEEPTDPGALVGLMAATRNLISDSLEMGRMERAQALGRLSLTWLERAQSLAESPELTRETANVHYALATLARWSDDVEESDRRTALANAIVLELANALIAEPSHERQGVLLEPNQGTKGPRDQGTEGSNLPDSAFRIPNSAWAKGSHPDSPGLLVVQEHGPMGGRTPAAISALYDLAALKSAAAARTAQAGDLAGAESLYVEAIDLTERALALDPTADPVYRTDVSEYAPLPPPILLHAGSRPAHERRIAHMRLALGSIAQERGDETAAREHMTAGLQIVERQAETMPDDAAVMYALAGARLRVARFHLDAGDRAAAFEHARGALALYQRLAQADPHNPSWLRSVAAACRDLARLAANPAGDFPQPPECADVSTP